MTESYQVGEIAILAHSPVRTEYAGQDCEVIGGLERRIGVLHGIPMHNIGYLIRMGDGQQFSVAPWLLRKRPPPREDLRVVDWAECPWQPAGIDA